MADLNGREHREETWQEGEGLFRSIAEAASDAIIVIDNESQMLFVNAAAEKIFGHTVAEMIGAPLFSTFWATERATLKYFGRCFPNRQVVSFGILCARFANPMPMFCTLQRMTRPRHYHF